MIGRHLRSVQIEKDDLFYIPAGMIHAICAGVLIAEVQENNNLLYRLSATAQRQSLTNQNTLTAFYKYFVYPYQILIPYSFNALTILFVFI